MKFRLYPIFMENNLEMDFAKDFPEGSYLKGINFSPDYANFEIVMKTDGRVPDTFMERVVRKYHVTPVLLR